jgi:hypothetical protein
MIFDSLTDRRPARPDTEPRYVCPLCGTLSQPSRRYCARCGGTPVVPVTDTDVYETVLPMCGPDCRRNRPDGESTGDPAPERERYTPRDAVQTLVRRVEAVAFTRWIRRNCDTNGS